MLALKGASLPPDRTRKVYSLEVGGELTVGDLKALMEAESSIPPHEMQLIQS